MRSHNAPVRALRRLDAKGVGTKPPYRPDDPDGWNVLLKDYAQSVRRIAKARSVTLVDTYQVFKDYSARDGHDLNDLMIDGMHPNDAGHALIAKHLIMAIGKEPK
jgi:lysophospholipase L1-like esterase